MEPNPHCWTCGKACVPFVIMPGVTSCTRHFRCDDCGVEWIDRIDTLAHVASTLIFEPLNESLMACLPAV